MNASNVLQDGSHGGITMNVETQPTIAPSNPPARNTRGLLFGKVTQTLGLVGLA